MKITFITLFPNYIETLVTHSIIKRSIEKGLVEIDYVNPRDFTEDNKIDDTVYGGGDGMLLMIEPLVKAINSVRTENSKVYLMGPRGPRFNQDKAKELSKLDHIILIAGHYEGVDARIKHYIDGEISIGDFILTGGEMPSMMIADAVIRLIPGVIKEGSHQNESFENNLLEHDHFTKPVDFEGHKVPEVLLSGNHKEIDK
jgi:tRNA (guanine37-N1)-methyltransferase